jgi:DNA repair exonuclease SbcCD ATPase subunit
MELVSLSLRHWRNIPRLSLDQLDRPLVVLAGPNRTGKTGIYSAIRAALFDDATSSSKEIKAYTAWGSEAAPEVILGFRHAGDEYRVHKRFTRGKESISRLERRTSAGWSKVADGKQLTTEVTRLLGIDKPDDSLLKLLWLPQGTTTLPTDLGSGLRRQFETVLGSLLTERDHRILESARSRVEEWFTSKGEPKVRTELATVQEELQQCERELADLLRQRDDTDHARNRYRDLAGRAAEAHRDLARSRRELAEKKSAFTTLQSRRAVHAQAAADLAKATQQESAARQSLADWQAEATRRDQAEQAARAARATCESTQATLREELTEFNTLETAAREASEKERATRTRLAALREQQRLQQLRLLRDQLRSEVESKREAQAQLDGYKADQAAILAPSDADWAALETTRRELAAIETKLASRSAQVTFKAASATSLRIELDERPAEERAFAAGEEWVAAVGSLATLSFPGIGELQIRQVDPQVHADLLRKKSALKEQQQTLLAPLGLSPDDAGLWDELTLRRERRTILTARIEQIGKTLPRETSPRDKGAASRDPAVELARIEAQLARSGQTESAPLEVASSDTEPGDLTDAIASAEQSVAESEEQLRIAHESLDRHRRQIETLRARANEQELLATQTQATLTAVLESLSRMGEESSLLDAVRAAVESVRQAEVKEVATRLTSDEERLEQDIREIEAAIERQTDRLRQAEGEQRSLEGEFRSRLGLHDELTRVESRKSELSSRLLRLEREGRARKLLHARLDDARRTQVGDVTRAISERTLAWADQLGLSEFHALDFDGGYLPSGLTRRDLDTPVALNDKSESFGTVEQLALLVRLAAGAALAHDTRQVAVLDDPLAHADSVKHRRMLEIFSQLVRSSPDRSSGLQLIVLTCHPERYDRLPQDVPVIHLADELRRSIAEG